MLVGRPLRIGSDRIGSVQTGWEGIWYMVYGIWHGIESDRSGSFGVGALDGDGQKSIHQWQICWWYESIMLPVKDRLSLIISLKIAQMTSVRHEMWSHVRPSVCRWLTVAHVALLWPCWLSRNRLKLTTTHPEEREKASADLFAVLTGFISHRRRTS